MERGERKREMPKGIRGQRRQSCIQNTHSLTHSFIHSLMQTTIYTYTIKCARMLYKSKQEKKERKENKETQGDGDKEVWPI